MTKEEAIKNIKEHCYFANLIPQAKEALDMAIKALEQEPSDTVSRGVFEQVMWERDVAISQLKKLGYELGQKVEPCEDKYIKVPKKALKYRTAGMAAYNAEWLKNHFDIERVAICGEQEPCEDAISRQWLMECVNEGWIKFDTEKDKNRFIHLVRDIAPSTTPQPKIGHWIPVSERLPEEHLCDDGYVEPSDYVLVWGDHGNYGVSRYWGNRRSKSESPNTYKDWMDLDWVVQKPIAWMPLPKPYESQESEDKA